jgi:nitrogen fixation NifU-like protein
LKKTNDENKSLDILVNSLQSEIERSEEEVFSKRTISEFRNPFKTGRMSDPDGFAVIEGWCGDSLEVYEVYLRISGKGKDTKIADTRFMTDGCGASIACGSMVTRLAHGRKVDEALRISKEDVIEALNGLPRENLHCATLAAETLKKALRKYKDRKAEG